MDDQPAESAPGPEGEAWAPVIGPFPVFDNISLLVPVRLIRSLLSVQATSVRVRTVLLHMGAHSMYATPLKLVCCATCERKRLAFHNADCIRTLTAAMQAHGMLVLFLICLITAFGVGLCPRRLHT